MEGNVFEGVAKIHGPTPYASRLVWHLSFSGLAEQKRQKKVFVLIDSHQAPDVGSVTSVRLQQVTVHRTFQ